ncbi:ser thr protein phosphatase family protein [Diplodia corticola]|uniref:Ser thr protein phosphatase family protein n=1 Tax=Diplodia corticola TaxID=236234 RepID=A0A1J9R5J9_9PEZI|nr:ser thr protein phosphatase family protein [Diplodia corticola]OJD35498.1 ser thr protein phosphatase family protein [Diplodia corticola]
MIPFVLRSAASIMPSAPGLPSYVASAGFPTSAFSSYYLPPSTTQEPQPALHDPVLNITFPLNLTHPDTIPGAALDPVVFPEPIANLTSDAVEALFNAIVANVSAIIDGGGPESNCSKCITALQLAKPAALYAPSKLPDAMVDLCKQYQLHSNTKCEEDFATNTFGSIWTQVLRFADLDGFDANYICNSLSKAFCPKQNTAPLDMATLFPKPKPADATAPKPSGNRVKVLHMSDIHLDPRYSAASEANCSASMCCRSNVENSALGSGQISFPAPLFGAYECDTPYDLSLAALQAVGPLTGTCKEAPLGWTVYTGDLVSHDPQSQLSRAYVEYTETSVYTMFKKYLTGPVFAALGNHDSNPEAIDSPHRLPGPLGQQQSWNYDHVAALWQHEGWIGPDGAAEARLHYGAYSIKNHYGLRIITFNTDFWYKSNFLAFINTTDPDNSGMFKWMINELQAAEDAGERAWIMGHVLSGWDGTNPLPNPTDLFYQIVDRYSPHVIANVFWGHTHEDQFMIYYANNGTVRDANHALMSGWIGPSVTPLTNVNSGFRLYEVDTGTFDVMDAWTFVANVSVFPDLSSTGPTYSLEYSTRDTYGPAADWPVEAPLNATFWHRVTEAMEKNHTLVSIFNTYQVFFADACYRPRTATAIPNQHMNPSTSPQSSSVHSQFSILLRPRAHWPPTSFSKPAQRGSVSRGRAREAEGLNPDDQASAPWTAPTRGHYIRLGKEEETASAGETDSCHNVTFKSFKHLLLRPTVDRHDPGLQRHAGPTSNALRRYMLGGPEEDPFPLYAKEARNHTYNLEQCEQTSTSVQGKRRERSASVPQGDAIEGGAKRHCSTLAGTEVKKDFACPYHKRFPRQRLPSSTCSHGFPSSTRVKEHLFRTHSLKQSRSKMPVHEMMFGPEEDETFKKRSKRNSSEAEKWTAFWRVLFPDMVLQGIIPSPYLDDEDASAMENGQLASFQALQYATLPEKFQERCAEVMARRGLDDKPGVDELIDMLSGLMRDVMKENGFCTTLEDDVRVNTSTSSSSTPVTQRPYPAVASSTAAGGSYTGFQAANTAQHKLRGGSFSANNYTPTATYHQPEDHVNHLPLPPPQVPVGTATIDSGYYSAEMKSSFGSSSSPSQTRAQRPLLADPSKHYHGRTHPAISSMDHSNSIPCNDTSHAAIVTATTTTAAAAAAAANNYPNWGSDDDMIALIPQQQQPQDYSSTDFAGSWANGDGDGDDEYFDVNEFFNERYEEMQGASASASASASAVVAVAVAAGQRSVGVEEAATPMR